MSIKHKLESSIGRKIPGSAGSPPWNRNDPPSISSTYPRPAHGDKQNVVSTIRIFETEVAFISRNAVVSGEIETGGFLHGGYTGSGDPVVMLATPPGPQGVHKACSYIADHQFVQATDQYLLKHFGLCTIGRWHSHHTLGLRVPSPQDLATARSLMQKNGLPAFVEMIVTFETKSDRVLIDTYVYRPN